MHRDRNGPLCCSLRMIQAEVNLSPLLTRNKTKVLKYFSTNTHFGIYNGQAFEIKLLGVKY